MITGHSHSIPQCYQQCAQLQTSHNNNISPNHYTNSIGNRTYHQDWVKYIGDNHFANISIKFRINLLNVYSLFSFTGNMRLFLIYNFELINIREQMAFGRTMLIDGRVGTFPAVFFDMSTEWPRGVPYVWWSAAQVSARALIDNIPFERRINFVLHTWDTWALI